MVNQLADRLSLKSKNRLLRVLHQAGDLSAKICLKHFGKSPTFSKKPDRTPVTVADRMAERTIRKTIKSEFRGHWIWGEEFGEEGDKNSEFRWWIDPIDGTLQYIRGLPFWGSVIGVEYQGEVIAGLINHPAIDLRIWAAKDLGCFANGKTCRVSNIKKLSDATVAFGSLKNLKPADIKKVSKICRTAYDNRGSLDIFSHSLVIQGHLDAMMEFKLGPHDISAVKICLEEAGGKFTDLKNRKTIYAGNAISSNSFIHNSLLRVQ
ncbi:MAG: hypothetical protein COV44_02145 [Deltaproteobacteria bacterium CG11_big_fil_rev_8_21_14_0_20_45_16]|nr:MAG: hypothetical protein COV44_02145 [Deltaproteobacteria bacterium CG11_big_fil_rev_8_21_14_0_20_45_16]